MLFANIAIVEKYNYLDDHFQLAYRWLKETDLLSLAVGSYQIKGDMVVANVQQYTTFPPEQRFFETHEKYFDIQYMVSGQEMFGVCKREGLIVKERVEESDLIFYQEPVISGAMLLEEGDLIVVAPEDAHKPRCIAGKSGQVKKIVIKIAI